MTLSTYCVKMISFSKVVVSLSMILTILVAFKFNVSESGGFLIPDKTIVEIINKLNNTQLGVHCKDKHHDLGFQTLQVDRTWSFRFRPNPFWQSTLYFCSFVWFQHLHHFDVYEQERDTCTSCNWEIFESGPCRITDESRDCFNWKD